MRIFVRFGKTTHLPDMNLKQKEAIVNVQKVFRVQNLNDTPQRNLVDTLINLIHYCLQEGIDFDKAVESAKGHAPQEVWSHFGGNYKKRPTVKSRAFCSKSITEVLNIHFGTGSHLHPIGVSRIRLIRIQTSAGYDGLYPEQER
jgi:hypothetical protein